MANKIAAALALLIAFGNFAIALSEYNYLFPEFSPSSTLIFIFAPRNCIDAASGFAPMERNFILEGNTEVFTNFDAAIRSQAKIRKISRYVQNVVNGIQIIGGAV